MTSNPDFDDKEQAEGSRETVDDALHADKGQQQGITNKPAEEQRQQEKVPPRRPRTYSSGSGCSFTCGHVFVSARSLPP
jgi:hypothetical protein